MKTRNLFYNIFIVLVMFSSCQNKTEKVAYVLNQKLFDSFDGTKEIKARLSKKETGLKNQMDSLSINIKLLQGKQDETSKKTLMYYNEQYNIAYEQYQMLGNEEVRKLNEQIWTQINQYVGEYGKEKGYTFLYGANGSGTIMYADSSKNVTEDLVLYINKKYKGE